MRFQARLGNQSIDFSNFWYKNSLIHYFKYDTGSFARKNICWPKAPKAPYKLTGYISNNKLTLNFQLCLFEKSTK